MKTKTLLLKTGLITVLLITKLQVSAQNAQCCNGRMSSIQIPNLEYQERVSEFQNSVVLNTLRNNRGGDHPLSAGTISLATFFSFITNAPNNSTGVKIYFGAYNQLGSPSHNELVPIYAFTNRKSGKDQIDITDQYYLYNPLQKKFENIPFAYAKSLHQHFSKKLKLDVTEVHALWYPMAKLTEWMNDICCQQTTTGNAINSIILDWAVYEKNVPDPVAGGELKTKGKLTLLFKIPNARPMNKKDDGAYDTAVPCPPGQNCNDGLDGL